VNSNEHPGAYGYQPQPPPRGAGDQSPRPMLQETALKTGELVVERKSYHLDLKENHQGRFLRITEKSGNRFAYIIIPATGLKDFLKLLTDMVEADPEQQPKPPAGMELS
jgi:hypothetical protein